MHVYSLYMCILHHIRTGGSREHSRAGERIVGRGKRGIRYIKGQNYDLSFLYDIYMIHVYDVVSSNIVNVYGIWYMHIIMSKYLFM